MINKWPKSDSHSWSYSQIHLYLVSVSEGFYSKIATFITYGIDRSAGFSGYRRFFYNLFDFVRFWDIKFSIVLHLHHSAQYWKCQLTNAHLNATLNRFQLNHLGKFTLFFHEASMKQNTCSICMLILKTSKQNKIKQKTVITQNMFIESK